MSAQTVAEATLASCSGVGVVYGSGEGAVAALRDVDLGVAEGESIALWGRSGSGKTTLLHVLGGLVEPSEGVVLFRGEALSSLDQAARARLRARSLAYVFQGANLLPYFSALENVSFAANLPGGGGGSGIEPAELLELVGLGQKLDALPAELSGGEAQRVAIARAIAQRPQLLLCDEPTGQLDSDTSERVLDLIDALQREFSFALVVATHDPNVAARYGRAVELEDGAVVAPAVA